MSMNIHIEASRVLYTKTGQEVVDTKRFPVFQTPTKISNEINYSANPVEAYKQWVRSAFEPEVVDVFAVDDFFQKTPIGTETVDVAENHIQELDTWLEECKANEYELIEVFVL